MRKLSDNITGAYLSELRKSKGFTQEQLAKIMHMHKSTIAHYMNYFDIVKMLKTINKQDKLIIYRILKLLNQ